MSTSDRPGAPELTFVDVSQGAKVSPHQARDAIVHSDRVVMIDFDHTLLASNSTELFIAACWPPPLAAAVDFTVRRCIPWRLTRIPHHYRLRDYVCVVLLVLLSPWNIRRWNQRAPMLFEQLAARDVNEIISGVPRSRIVVISFGFEFVIKSLLRGSDLEQSAVIATPFVAGLSRFREGKLPLAEQVLGPAVVSSAVFLSDSMDDEDLLRRSAIGLLVPQQGTPFRAQARLYLPMRYTSAVKYTPGYTLDQFLLVDTAILAIAGANGLASLLHLALITPLLLLSFMCVYEIGYFDNDMSAARSEAHPTLGARVPEFVDYPIRLSSWLWSLVLAGTGIALSVILGELARDDVVRASSAWVSLLVVTRLVFVLYNRTRTHQRIYLYPLLQGTKYGSILMIVVPTVAGVVLIVSQVLTMWMIYAVYRLGGRPKGLNKEVVRLLIFAAILTPLLVTSSRDGFDLLASSGNLISGEVICIAAAVLWSAARLAKAPLMTWRHRTG